jgi:hypothetical protein
MTCGFMAISFRTKGLAGDRADLHCRARLPSSLDTGPDALAPGVIAPARRTGMSHGRAFVPDGGASLPAIHDATAVSRTVAAGAATIRGVDLADAWNDRDNTRYQNRPHVLPPSLVAQSTLHLVAGCCRASSPPSSCYPAPSPRPTSDRAGGSGLGCQLGWAGQECIRVKGNPGERNRLCSIKLEDTDHESSDLGTGFRICLLRHLRPGTQLQAYASPHAPFARRPSER